MEQLELNLIFNNEDLEKIEQNKLRLAAEEVDEQERSIWDFLDE